MPEHGALPHYAIRGSNIVEDWPGPAGWMVAFNSVRSNGRHVPVATGISPRGDDKASIVGDPLSFVGLHLAILWGSGQVPCLVIGKQRIATAVDQRSPGSASRISHGNCGLVAVRYSTPRLKVRIGEHSILCRN